MANIRKIAVFIAITFTTLANATVDRYEALSCEGGALKILAEVGEYGRHQLLVNDPGIWRHVTNNHFTEECSPDPSKWDKTCIGQNSTLVSSVYTSGHVLPGPLTWLNSREGFRDGDRWVQLTVYRDGNVIRFELMSVVEFKTVWEGDQSYEITERAPKIKYRDWIFRNCIEI